MSAVRPKASLVRLLTVLLILVSLNLEVRRASASVTSASELIQLVNQLRKANGLPPYQVNQALMAAAQAHSEYQASIGKVTHTGRGGTRPRDRAIAAGYGSGATVFVSENIAGGMNLSAAEAVNWWQGDSLHLTTMLSANYQDVGAGVAVSGDTVYYTLDAGYVAGAATPAPTQVGSSATKASPKTPAPTALAIVPVQAATPRPDGSIIHVVEQGQALWNIAAVYKVSLADLLALNNLTEGAFIHPGDKLLVRPAQTTSAITASPIISATARLAQPTTTRLPASTPPLETTTPLLADAPPQNAPPSDASLPDAKQTPPAGGQFDPLLLLIAILVVLGTGLILLGSLSKRRA